MTIKKDVTKMDIVKKRVQFSWQPTWGNVLQEIIDSDKFSGIFTQPLLNYCLKKRLMEMFNILIKQNCYMQWIFQRKWIKILI